MYILVRSHTYKKLSPNVYAPPGIDSGAVPNAQWPLALSQKCFGTGKQSRYIRQQNAATNFAGVDMHLAPGAQRNALAYYK